MRGSRCKALKKSFVARFGRTPNHMVMIDDNAYKPSEWRRLKKAYVEARRAVR